MQTPTDNIEAYTWYLKGREFLHRGSKTFYKRRATMFVKAAELDPSYARAYAGIADCDTFLYLRTTESISLRGHSGRMSEKALALDNDLAEAHASRGCSAFGGEKRYEEAADGIRASDEARSQFVRSALPLCAYEFYSRPLRTRFHAVRARG